MKPGQTIRIPRDFNGPPANGNGGYSCGVVAAFIETPAEVNLRAPVPLDTSLAVQRSGDGVRVFDGETLIADGAPAPGLEIEVPEPVGVEEAREASRHYEGPFDGPFSRCFVCGRMREDSFGVFAGRVPGRDLMATPWTPPEWTADDSGRVRPEFVWAALDCPASFAAYLNEEGELIAFLVRLGVRIECAVAAGEEHVVISWPLGGEGRKREAGSAVVSRDGGVMAAGRALLVEPRAAA
jgi:hypothetical protein